MNRESGARNPDKRDGIARSVQLGRIFTASRAGLTAYSRNRVDKLQYIVANRMLPLQCNRAAED